ncbi:uncharacterized protein Z518_08482 [Rhinocladiella mackenziei CBS 650.93]|uniref:Rhinocladiella mackenziei CBS 650.93 unplaced genomic scaffold supercont1.6, whole genome shotgun sequence n=1 Tax=Rhinocladiella mackenziei CBS 650.93 TaxID=1442369 RepID=A0A0D2IGY5_9EURO|nr:uncharacterized protein Z518_08482 [Rhinocladiella mackenziei CBS 650.93]KIX02541.1 hypothetical protein Z518_08482 [Rhinocladiella mackenziei CBS 650.93]
MIMAESVPWWKDATVYQIWPTSFKDSNGDGIGDLPGVISALDYLKDLGIDTIWLSPIYRSPQVDMGYDISDYEAVYEPFGTMADMEDLIASCHSRGMRLILDLVINHTSREHAWFKESRESKENPKRDWYIWRSPVYDAEGHPHPPNNWRSAFGGSVWEWDELSQEYYLHYFTPDQPDLNWENEETRRAIFDSAITFWLEKGVDGFRIDTVNKFSKPPTFFDAPVSDPTSRWQYAYNLFCNGPKIHDYLKEINEKVLSAYGEIMTVGELPCTPDRHDIVRYVSAHERELNMVFHFDMIYLGMGTVKKYMFEPFTLTDFKRALSKWQYFIDGTDTWTTVFGENHDSARSVSRFASDAPEHRATSAKLLALLFITLTGTLFIYQGQEIGMINIPPTWGVDEYKDIESRNFYNSIKEQSGNDPIEMHKAKMGLSILARDHARTPMQWSSSSHAGFTSGPTPWMRVHDSYTEINVERQSGDERSVLRFWKTLLQWRKQYRQLFVHGLFREFDHNNPAVFTYLKISRESNHVADHDCHLQALVTLNFSGERQSFMKPEDLRDNDLELLITNVDIAEPDSLAPYEGRVYWVKKTANSTATSCSTRTTAGPP